MLFYIYICIYLGGREGLAQVILVGLRWEMQFIMCNTRLLVPTFIRNTVEYYCSVDVVD